MQRNTAKEKRKRNKGYPYHTFIDRPHHLGGKLNPIKSYAIRFVDSKKVLETYRTKSTALYDLPKYKDIFKKELEIVKLK